jgi:hypothetical protein
MSMADRVPNRVARSSAEVSSLFAFEVDQTVAQIDKEQPAARGARVNSAAGRL